MASPQAALPPIVPFPEAAWRDHLVPEEWEACLDAWVGLTGAHLALSNPDSARISTKDESLTTFLVSYVEENALSQNKSSSKGSPRTAQLRKHCYLLCLRLVDSEQTPSPLLDWSFLADFCKIYGHKYGSRLIVASWRRHSALLEFSLGSLKSFLTKELDAGLKGDIKTAEAQLKRLNHLLFTSPDAASFFMAGSDFLDSIISCYRLMNPPLRNALISTTYLCLVGLTEGERPQYSSLVDQLYSLKSAAEAHKAGPTNVNDSLVAELVTATPVLKKIQHRIDADGTVSKRAKPVIAALEAFRKPGGSSRLRQPVKHKINKGKAIASQEEVGHSSTGLVHVHRMSLITQVQDLFPDLGSGFIVKLLDEYNDDVEQTIAHLLENSLPAHLDHLNRSQQLDPISMTAGDHASDLESRSFSESFPIRKNVFDDDEFDRLAIDTSRLHFGQRNSKMTADDILEDRSNAPNKAAILSALAAFDSDDDERDDTYDVEDVGGTVDSATPGNNPEEANSEVRDVHDEALFKAFKSTPTAFGRDAATRRGSPRTALKEETGMTDEAIEGWGLMLSRDPRRLKRLEAKFSNFQGSQGALASTAWRAGPIDSEESDRDGNNRGRGGARQRGGRGGRGRGRGNVAGAPGDSGTEAARHNKEANKGSRANHNRRDQRAKKMARGGFPG